MLFALCLLVAAAFPAEERTLVVDGRPLGVPRTATVGGVPLALDLLVSAEERAIVATLVHRAWTPRDPGADPAHPEPPALLAGRGPDVELEHAGARIDERYRLLLWRLPERLRGLPSWLGVAAKQSGIRPLLPHTPPPASVHAALDRGSRRLRMWEQGRSEEHTSELQSHSDPVSSLLLEQKQTEE